MTRSTNARRGSSTPLSSDSHASLGRSRTGSVTTRRRFLAASAAVASAATWTHRVARAAEDRPLRLGVIGVANRGGANLSGVESETIAAICDVDQGYLDAVGKKHPKAARYHDYREMLDAEEELDGVVISTPDHHHAPATMRAIARGLPVYCEKPLTHTVEEARVIAAAAREAGVATQMGTQIHATENYRRVVEKIRAGAVGTVSRIHVWVGKGWSADAMPAPSGEPAPDSLAWDSWLGPAPERDYTPGLHPRDWRRYRAYGAGTLGDMGCHYIDLPFWALELGRPTRVVADGPPADSETCPHGLRVRYRFAATEQHDELELVWHDGKLAADFVGGKKLPGSGVLFEGDRGKMLATYGSHSFVEGGESDLASRIEPIPSSIGHHAEWLAAIRGGDRPLCHFDYAGPLTETVLLGTVAHRAGRPLKWDGDAGKCVGDEAATGMLGKDYREGWSLNASVS